jgi:hypothetical protein
LQITANTTPFLAELFVPTDKHGQKHCVLVVKGTFDIDVDGECTPALEQVPFVFVDQHHGDPGSTAIRYECDFVPVKPRAEVLLNASAVAPGARPVKRLEVSLGGPGLAKKALVIGDRLWLEEPNGFRPSEPEPFTSMPISWDRGFGGADLSHEDVRQRRTELRNLVGLGFHVNSFKDTIVGNRLPNIERPEEPMRLWSDKPEPIGFGPVGRAWQPRIRFAGTYDQRWMDETSPFLPEDFDDRYFQAAPLDQQLPGLSPGVAFGCFNMNEKGPVVLRIPSFDIPVRFVFDDRIQASRLLADTLIIEPNIRRTVIAGRTGVPLPRKFSKLREIQVGPSMPGRSAGKPHFKSLGEAVATLRRSR